MGGASPRRRRSLKVRLSEDADRDLDDLYAYLAPLNAAAADRMVLKLLATARSLADAPARGRPGRVDGTRELAVTRTPYLIIYRLSASTVEIARILHGARRWPPEP